MATVLRTPDIEEILEMPSAQEIRDYQSKLRRAVIEGIWEEAQKGYKGVTFKKGGVPEPVLKELEDNGYTVNILTDYINIVWGEDN